MIPWWTLVIGILGGYAFGMLVAAILMANERDDVP